MEGLNYEQRQFDVFITNFDELTQNGSALIEEKRPNFFRFVGIRNAILSIGGDGRQLAFGRLGHDEYTILDADHIGIKDRFDEKMTALTTFYNREKLEAEKHLIENGIEVPTMPTDMEQSHEKDDPFLVNEPLNSHDRLMAKVEKEHSEFHDFVKIFSKDEFVQRSDEILIKNTAFNIIKNDPLDKQTIQDLLQARNILHEVYLTEPKLDKRAINTSIEGNIKKFLADKDVEVEYPEAFAEITEPIIEPLVYNNHIENSESEQTIADVMAAFEADKFSMPVLEKEIGIEDDSSVTTALETAPEAETYHNMWHGEVESIDVAFKFPSTGETDKIASQETWLQVDQDEAISTDELTPNAIRNLKKHKERKMDIEL